ncbi:class I SAM-dependent methyltransferase [Patescibacteria group bacterium]
MNLETTNCLLCGGPQKKTLFLAENTHGDIPLSQERFPWVKCLDCGLFYLNPRPNQKSIWQYYSKNYYDPKVKVPQNFLEAYRWFYNQARLRLVIKFAPLTKKLLDLGSGEGVFVKVAKQAGLEALGIDPYQSRKNLKDYRFKDEAFDAVTLWHVLEHLHQPQKELSEIKRILKKEGQLFLSLPNFSSFGFRFGKVSWFHLDTPRHLAGYRQKVVTRLLQDCGFKVLKIYFPALEDPFDLLKTINRKIFKQNYYLRVLFFLPIFSISLIFKTVSPLFRASETIQVVAEKK